MPLSCRLDQIVQIMRDGSPSAVDIVGWILAVLAVAASTFVGVAAWRTSNRAAEVADTALREEVERDKERYAILLSESIARFFQAVGEYLAEVSSWLHRAGEIEITAGSVNPDELSFPPKPSFSKALALLEASRLNARGDDQDVLHHVNAYVQTMRDLHLVDQEPRLTTLLSALRRWREGSWSTLEVHKFMETGLRSMRAKISSKKSKAKSASKPAPRGKSTTTANRSKPPKRS